MSGRRPRVLAVGMLPPPVGGQSVMFEAALEALRARAHVDVVDIQVQGNIGESGALTPAKLRRLAELLARRMLPLWAKPAYDVLYYCPAGPNALAVLKDLLFLALLRPRARRTVYHFHATGSGAFIEGRSPALRAAARRVLFHPDLAIRCAAVQPDDARAYGAKAQRVIANGIPDPGPAARTRRPPGAPATLTFMGALVEEKGLYDLVEIVAAVRDRGRDVRLDVLGEGTPDAVRRFDALVAERGLAGVVRRLGVVTGAAKRERLAGTAIFVFPSFFRAETQPLAVIEAHAMGVPVVAYAWRGLDTIVEDGATGHLVPVRATAAFAERIVEMLEGDRIEEMGRRARARFEERFTLERFTAELTEAVLEVAAA